MKKDWIFYVRLYAVELIILGLLGYVWNPDKAITSLILASGVGSLLYLVTVLPRSIIHNKWGGITIGSFLCIYGFAVLVRAVITWISWKGGIESKLVPALLLTSISFSAFVTFCFVIRSCPTVRK
ncbi:MAG: hypothetical protein QRY74_02345 [Chlamydia sp.]